MRITLVSGVAGPRYAYEPGQTVEHPDEREAQRWIARGTAIAAPVVADPAAPGGVELAAPGVVETAAHTPPAPAVFRRLRRTRSGS